MLLKFVRNSVIILQHNCGFFLAKPVILSMLIVAKEIITNSRQNSGLPLPLWILKSYHFSSLLTLLCWKSKDKWILREKWRWLMGTDFFLNWFHAWFGGINLTWILSLTHPLTPSWKFLLLVTLENFLIQRTNWGECRRHTRMMAFWWHNLYSFLTRIHVFQNGSECENN